MAAGLEASLELDGPAVVGLPILALLRVANRGAEALTVSARLNLMEGDVALTVEDPGGSPRCIRGWQADTQFDAAELPPAHQLIGAMTLLETPEGAVFPTPGDYLLSAEYRPSPRMEPVSAEPIPVKVVAPRDDGEKTLAGLLAEPALRQALLMGDKEQAADKLREIAERFPGTYAGRLAALSLGEAGDAGPPSEADALALLALRNPYNRNAARLGADLAARIEASDAPSDLSALLRRRAVPIGA